jgi:hypothetical protein
MWSAITTVFQVLGGLATVGLLFVAVQAIMVPDAEAKRLQIKRFWKTAQGSALYVLLGAEAVVSLYRFLHVCLFAWPLTPGLVLDAAIDWSMFLIACFVMIFCLPLMGLLRVMLDQIKALGDSNYRSIERIDGDLSWHTRLFESLAEALPKPDGLQPEAPVQLSPGAPDAEPDGPGGKG